MPACGTGSREAEEGAPEKLALAAADAVGTQPQTRRRWMNPVIVDVAAPDVTPGSWRSKLQLMALGRTAYLLPLPAQGQGQVANGKRE